MKKPYNICHMMTSVDGRIDCAMTSQLPGIEDYYVTLDMLDVPTTVSGRVTAELELAEPGTFQAKDNTPFGKEGFSKKTDSAGYEIIVDTHGKLLWHDAAGMEKPYLIITGEEVPREYLQYLDGQHISWIACGNKKINLSRACEILAEEFKVERMGIVGGAAINTAFLNEGLLDEISILIGPGVDGRTEMSSVFDGREMNDPLTHLSLTDVKKLTAVRYGCVTRQTNSSFDGVTKIGAGNTKKAAK